MLKGLNLGKGSGVARFATARITRQSAARASRPRANDPPCVELPVLELGKKAGILGPEEPDVRHVVQDHGQALQTQAVEWERNE